MTKEAASLGLFFIFVGILLVLTAPRVDVWLRDRRSGAHQDEGRLREGARVSELASSDDLNAEEELNVRTWAISRERDSYIARRGRSFLYAMAGGSVLFGAFGLFAGVADSSSPDNSALWRTIATAAVVLGSLVLIYSFAPYLSARSAYRQRRLALASARVDYAISKACEGEKPLKIGHLFELNRRQLDEYQLLTRKQQRSSFLLAQVASVVAFAVLITGIFIALSAESDVDKFLTSGLTALGSLLSGFLAATFFESSKDANRQMNRYYLEPQRTGRLLAAERIITQVEPDGPSRSSMVTAVLGWEMPGEKGKKDKHGSAPAPAQQDVLPGAATNGAPAGANT